MNSFLYSKDNNLLKGAKMKRLCLIICVFGLMVLGSSVANTNAIDLRVRTFIQGIEVSGQRPIRGVALGPDESKLYAAYWTHRPSPVAVYSTTDLTRPLYLETDPDYPLVDKMSYGKCHGGVAGSRDGRYLFTPSYYEGNVSRFDISVLDPNEPNPRDELPAGNWSWDIGISPDGCKLVVQAGCDGRSYDMNNDAVYIYDICEGNFSLLCIVPLDDEPEVKGFAFSDDSRFVYITTHKRKSSQPRLYEVSITPPCSVTRYLEFPNPSNRLGSVTTNGRNLFVSDTDNSRVWVVDPESWSVIDYIELSFAPWGISMHPDGQHLFVLPWYELFADYISVFDVSTKGLVGHIDGIHHGAEDIVFTQDGQTAYVAHCHATEGGITILGLSKVETDPPVADAGDDIIASANEEVTLDGSNSYDPDGEIIQYTWKRLPDGMVIYSGEEPTCQTRALGRAEEVIELTVTDNYLATATDTVRIVSRNTQDLQDQVAAMQSQIEELQRQIQELQALVDKIVSWPPVKQWLRRPTNAED